MRPVSSLFALARRALLAPMQLGGGTILPTEIFGPQSIALYVHFPFCTSFCEYCVFNKKRPRREELETYVAALEREIAFYGRVPQLAATTVRAVFFGGGTPSVLPAELIERTLFSLRHAFRFADDVQITLEANPESTAADKLACYRRAGVNRVSLGVQSFDARLLASLGRHHRPAQIHAALDAVRAAGIDELNLDLMVGLPGETPAELDADLDALVASPATHASIFAMIYRPEAPLWGRREERSTESFYARAAQRLEGAGFRQYTAEDFTRSGETCHYQEEVWRAGPKGYLGFGAGAMSMYGSAGWHNVGPVDAYVAASRADAPPIAGGGTMGAKRQMLEHLMVAARGLRVDREAFALRFGGSVESVVGPAPRLLELLGLLSREPGGSWAVTRRGAYYVSVLWGELVLNQCAQAGRAVSRASA